MMIEHLDVNVEHDDTFRTAPVATLCGNGENLVILFLKSSPFPEKQ